MPSLRCHWWREYTGKGTLAVSTQERYVGFVSSILASLMVCEIVGGTYNLGGRASRDSNRFLILNCTVEQNTAQRRVPKEALVCQNSNLCNVDF